MACTRLLRLWGCHTLSCCSPQRLAAIVLGVARLRLAAPARRLDPWVSLVHPRTHPPTRQGQHVPDPAQVAVHAGDHSLPLHIPELDLREGGGRAPARQHAVHRACCHGVQPGRRLNCPVCNGGGGPGGSCCAPLPARGLAVQHPHMQPNPTCRSFPAPPAVRPSCARASPHTGGGTGSSMAGSARVATGARVEGGCPAGSTLLLPGCPSCRHGKMVPGRVQGPPAGLALQLR